MTFEETKKLIQTIVSNPEEATIAANTLIEELKNDYDSMDGMKHLIEEQTEKITSLQDTNVKLFLRMTGEAKEQEEEEKTPEEKVDDFWSQFN